MEEREDDAFVFKKKEINSNDDNQKKFKKNYICQRLLSTIPLVSLAGCTVYVSIKKNQIPLIDIISLGMHKASKYNKQIETLFKQIPFNNIIYWQSFSELFFTTPNILLLSTLGTAYALPQVAKRVFPFSTLNSTEANEIIKSTDPFIDYIEFFKHIPVRTTNITEFCLSIKETNYTINLSEKQKIAFAAQINNMYKLESLLYDFDFFTNSTQLQELINALEFLKIDNSNVFFEKNEGYDNKIENIKTKVTTLKEKLAANKILEINFLEKLKIKQQTLQHIKAQKEEEEEEEINIDINNEEETKKFLEISYTSLESLEKDLKNTNSLVKKNIKELKEIYESQKELYQEVSNLKNPQRELFETEWNGISKSQQETIIREIAMNEKFEIISSYALNKLSPNTTTIQSLYLEKKTEDFIKTTYKNDFKSKIIYFIKSSLPGHKINQEIEEKKATFQSKKIKTGIEYHIEIISKLPTAELKDTYQEEHFQHYTIENYKQYLNKEKFNALDMVTLSTLIKSKIFQNFVIDNLEIFDSELIIKLTAHSPFLLALSDTYTKDYNKNNQKKKKKSQYNEEHYKKFESFLKNITILVSTSDNLYLTLSTYLKLSLNKYLKKNSEQNTEFLSKKLGEEEEENYKKLLTYFNQQEEIKKHFIIPSSE